MPPLLSIGAAVFAVIAGVADLRTRRIPNWVTAPAALFGIVANTALGGWLGLKASLLGLGLGLLLLLPFVLLKSLGAGDWKLAGALGAFTGPSLLVDLLLGTVFVAGVMAVALVIYKGRVRETLRNMAHMVLSLARFQMPGPEVSLDNPQSLRIPFGVALAVAVLLYAGLRVRSLV